MTVVGLILIGLFVPFTMSALFQKNRYLQAISSDEKNYCVKHFGLFWGVSTTLFVTAFVAFYIDLQHLNHLGLLMQGIWIFYITFIFFPASYAAFHIVLQPQFRLTVPHLYLHLAKFYCRGSESIARRLVAFLVIWFDMLALQLLCRHVLVAILAFPAAPLAIVSNALLIAVVGAIVIYIIAFLFTIAAKLTNLCGTPEGREHPPAVPDRIVDDSWSYLLHAGITIPFQIALALFVLPIVNPLSLGLAGANWDWWPRNEDGRQEQTIEEFPHKQLVEELPQEQLVEELPQEELVKKLPQQQASDKQLPQEKVIEELQQEPHSQPLSH